MTYRRVRLIYQVVLFALFVYLVAATTQGVVERYPVKTFLNMSVLAGVSTFLANHTFAAGMFLGVVILAATVFLGRFFCGWVCPMGITQHLAFVLFKAKNSTTRYQRNTYRRSQRAKYFILAGVILAALFGLILAGWFDPIALITRFAVTVVTPLISLITGKAVSQTVAFNVTLGTAVIVLGAFALNLWQPRFWCRTLCPLGAAFAIFSRRPLLRMVRDEDTCIDCGKCREVCHGACQIDKEFIPAECVMCMNCIDVCPVRAIRYTWATKAETRTTEAPHGPLPDVSRREFAVSALGALGAVAVLKNLKTATGRGHPLRIRPPAARIENDFLATCIRCGQCMKVCPTNVIQPASHQAGLEGLWTPILDMNVGYCAYDCTLCSQVCPTEAIRPITVDQKHNEGYEKIGNAFVDRGRCLPWSFGRPCLVCQEVCPVSPKAIYHQKRSFFPENAERIWMDVPYVDPERCIGCGACQYNCPVQDLPAIRVTSIGEARSPDRKLTL